VETPSPISSTTPVTLPDAYSDRTDYKAMYNLGTLKFSNIISQIFSLFLIGFKATNENIHIPSEIKQGYSSGWVLISL